MLYLAALLAPATAHAQDVETHGEADLILDEVLREDRLPSLSVAVSVGGRLAYSRAIGLADVENAVAATPMTVYPIGSVTKPLTAAAALQLAERGDLDLDAPVSRYCEAWPSDSVSITTRQLLSHTAGIRHYDYRRFEEDFLNRRPFGSIAEALGKFSADPRVGVPGEAYHYSSWGYVLVGCVIEGAAGVPFPALLEQAIVDPAGLERTRLNVLSDIVADRARGYSLTDSARLVNAGLFDPSDRYPSGGLLSTPVDLTRFADALMGGELLAASALEAMWTSATLSSGAPTGHGLGWDLGERGEVFHGGTTVGGTAYLYLRPRDRIAVAIATNLSLWSRDREALAARLADLFGR